MVKIGDRLYSTSDDKKLKCLDLKSGMVVDSLSNMRGTLISADNHLYCYTDNGRVNLIQLTGTKMEVVSQFKIEKGTKEHFLASGYCQWRFVCQARECADGLWDKVDIIRDS